MLWGLALTLTFAHSASAYIAPDRWNNTATNGGTGSQGTPVTVTWSLAPDGTQVAGGDGLRPSDMIAWLDANMGAGPGGSDLTLRPWFWLFENSFARINELSGVTYVYEPNDDGVNWSSGNSGNLGTRGDVRIGGKTWGSSTNVLASNFFPDYGDMQLNTDKTSFYFNSGSNYRRFRNTIMHEAGHGLGISHVESNNAGFLMEPSINTSFDGPQLDDILALHRLYGDVHEKNGGNNNWSSALDLGTLTDLNNLIIGTRGDTTSVNASHTDFISIDDNSDNDYLSFTISEALQVTLNLTPKGPTYNVGPQDGTQSSFDASAISDLTLRLYDTNGTSLLQTANATGAGSGETIVRNLDPGTYYARVTGAANNIQLYQLELTALDIVPDELFWFGLFSGSWDVGANPNFKDDGGAFAFFQTGDNVTFDDTANFFGVQVAQDVAPSRVTINAVNDYSFFGPGAIIGTGELVKNNSNTFDLQTDGNSYSGNTTINAGTMIISGNANAMVSAITINAGGTLVMDASDAATMGSTFTVNAGGTLQIGTLTSDANVFPDSPAGLVNEGTVLVLDDETVSNMSGTGVLQVDNETATLSGNGSFDGEVVVNGGGTANPTDANGLGTTMGSTTLNDGGVLLIDSNLTLGEHIAINGTGGKITAGNGATVTLEGSVTSVGGELINAPEPGGAEQAAAAPATEAVICPHCGGAHHGHDHSHNRANATAGVLTLEATTGSSLVLNQQIALDAGSIDIVGDGEVKITSTDNTYGGDTVVYGGTLNLTGNTGVGQTIVHAGRITGGGTVEGDLVIETGGENHPGGERNTGGGPFAPSAADFPLVVNGNYTQQAGGTLDIDILNTSVFDKMNVVGDASLAGALTLVQHATLNPGDAYVALTSNQLTGRFDQTLITGYEIDTDHMVAVLYEDSDSDTFEDQVRLYATLIGDANGDGDVTLLDLNRLGANFGTGTTWQEGDFNYDGQVTLIDLNRLGARFGMTVNPPSSPAVPEPVSLALLALGVGMIGRRPNN